MTMTMTESPKVRTSLWFGLSWQIVPKRLIELMYGPKAAQVWPALMQMKRIDIVALEAAAEAP